MVGVGNGDCQFIAEHSSRFGERHTMLAKVDFCFAWIPLEIYVVVPLQQIYNSSIHQASAEPKAAVGGRRSTELSISYVIYDLGNLETTFAAVAGRSITPPW